MQIGWQTNTNNKISRENLISKELTTRPPFSSSYVYVHILFEDI